MHSLFLVLSIIASIVTPIIGITSILRGSFKPQRMTRFLIFGISLLFVGTLYAQGDHNSIFMALVQLVSTGTIFFLSLKRGIGGTDKLDFIVLGLALTSLIIWQTTNNPTLGLVMSILTDFIGFSPTLVKTWKLPFTEDWKFYLSDIVASTFSFLSITTLSFENIIFPIYIFLINTVSVVLILSRRQLSSKQ